MENLAIILEAVWSLVSGAWLMWLSYSYYGFFANAGLLFVFGIGMVTVHDSHASSHREPQSRLFRAFRRAFFWCVFSLATALWLYAFCNTSGGYCTDTLGLVGRVFR